MKELIGFNLIFRILLSFILFFFFTIDVESADIIIPDNIEVNKSEISLGDIAEIENASSENIDILQSIELGEAPSPGYSKKINKRFIKIKIKNAGLSENDFNLDMSDEIDITLDTTEIGRKEILSSVREYLIDKLPEKDIEEEDIEIEVKFMPEEVKVPAENFKLNIASKPSGNFSGNISLPIEIINNGDVWKRIYIGLDVLIKKEVLVANKNHIRGNKLKKENFDKKTRKLTDLKKNYITRWDESLIENNIIGIPLEKGEILTWDHIIEDNNIFKEMDLETDEENDGDNEEKDNMFNDPYVIRWGDEVTAEIESGGIKVTATVKSRESGKTGDSILVENINSGKKFNAEIIEPDLVKVKD